MEHISKARCPCTCNLKECQCSLNTATPYFRRGDLTAKWNKFSRGYTHYQSVRRQKQLQRYEGILRSVY